MVSKSKRSNSKIASSVIQIASASRSKNIDRVFRQQNPVNVVTKLRLGKVRPREKVCDGVRVTILSDSVQMNMWDSEWNGHGRVRKQ